FIFYFGIISAISPPVALASIVAAGIADSRTLPTSMTSLKLGLPGFLIPFMFVLGPELVLNGSAQDIILSVLTSLIGIYALATSVQRYFIRSLRLWESFILGAASLVLLYPGYITDAIGVTIIVKIGLYIMKTNRSKIIRKAINE